MLRCAMIPDFFMCPISASLMLDPVVASDGHSYERTAIEQWLLRRRTSPKTDTPLESLALVPNHSLRRAIQQWKEQQAIDKVLASVPLLNSLTTRKRNDLVTRMVLKVSLCVSLFCLCVSVAWFGVHEECVCARGGGIDTHHGAHARAHAAQL